VTAPLDPLAEIRRLYFATSKRTIADDFARAIDLLKQLPDEAARERAAVFMEGLAELRSEWGLRPAAARRRAPPPPRRRQR
jgi:hypothetical protein